MYVTNGYAENNYVHDCGPRAYGINTQRNSQYIYIRNNIVDDCGVNGNIKM